MYFPKNLVILLSVLAFNVSCNNNSNQNWTSAVPEKTSFVVVPDNQADIRSVLDSPYIPFLDDITFSAIQLVSQVDSGTNAPVSVKAILLYPGVGNELQSVWITTAPEDYTDQLQTRFYRSFSQNQYHFKGTTIHRLHIQDRILFACQLNGLLLLSESSLGVEDAIRAYLGLQPAADLSEAELTPGSVVMNSPSLDKWLEQISKVIYRPVIKGAMAGTKPAVLQVSNHGDEQNSRLEFSGTLPLGDNPRSELVAAFSEENAPVQLDRYISSNVAAFGIFRLNPRLAPPASVNEATALDSVLMEDKVLYSQFAKTLDREFAMATYAESGFLSTGEHLFIRKLNNISALRSALNRLDEDDLIRRSGSSYLVSSQVLAQLIGSELCGFRDFYLNITGDTVVISKRKGLAEVVASDRSRRRVIYYEQSYMDIRKNFPDDVSGLIVLNTDFEKFITPFLAPENYVSALTSKFDLLTLTTQLDQTGENLDFNLTTYKSEKTNVPYQEQWLFPTGGTELSGPPVLADIGGSTRDEIVFATRSGEVYALAADGTVVLQVNTDEEDTPIGSPVVFDWYGTNQSVIMIAAGKKVYAWNDTGQPLPKFPFELNETITTPLSINDVDRNGLPEAIVATDARRLHALDGRGNNLDGWPLTTNTVVRTKPLIEYFQGDLSVLAFSENAVHAWTPAGNSKPGFPKFVNASLRGSPVLYENNILGGAADGYLYSIGNNITFSDSLNIFNTTSDSSGIGAVYVSNSSLNGSPSAHELTVETDDNIHQGSMILTMSSNGSVFLLSDEGQLLFTQSMGQPSAPGSSPLITDLNSNGQSDVVALANYGRLYAWQVSNGERIYSIPTSGIQQYIIEDIDGDGYKELIAQTREGVRCWTIYGGTRE